MNHDAIELFPLDAQRALLAVKHEHTDDGPLHPDGMPTWTAEKVAQEPGGTRRAVIEGRFSGGSWTVVRPSLYARRITRGTMTR